MAHYTKYYIMCQHKTRHRFSLVCRNRHIRAIFMPILRRRNGMKGYFKKGSIIVGFDFTKDKSKTVVTIGRFVNGVFQIEETIHGASAMKILAEKITI